MEYNMKYTDALKMLCEIMKERPDINEVKFNRNNDTFDVICDNVEHLCLVSEFKHNRYSVLNVTEKTFETVISVLIDSKIRAENYNRNGINDVYIERINSALIELKEKWSQL